MKARKRHWAFHKMLMTTRGPEGWIRFPAPRAQQFHLSLYHVNVENMLQCEHRIKGLTESPLDLFEIKELAAKNSEYVRKAERKCSEELQSSCRTACGGC